MYTQAHSDIDEGMDRGRRYGYDLHAQTLQRRDLRPLSRTMCAYRRRRLQGQPAFHDRLNASEYAVETMISVGTVWDAV